MITLQAIKNLVSLRNGHERSIKAKKNIYTIFFTNTCSILIGLALVPLTIHYLSPTRYGIWITISSLLGWLGFFDIGLGNGLRNKFAESLAKGEIKAAKIYVSTAYAILTLIIISLLIVFIIVNEFINWNTVLNVQINEISPGELNLIVFIVFVFTSFGFVAELIKSILNADQRNGISTGIDLAGKIVSLSLVYFLTLSTDGSLLNLSFVMSLSPLFVLLLSSLWLFRGRYSDFKPSLNAIDFSKARGILNLGIKFFIIRISAIMLYQTNSIIISHLFGPEEVTPYYVAFRYFSLIMMGYTIIVTPFWSSFTEAWIKKEYDWIKRIINKLILIWGALAFSAVLMVAISKTVYNLWIGAEMNISYSLSILISVWVILLTFVSIFGQFLNGVGKIKLQLLVAFSIAIINIPLCIFLGEMIGIEGVVLANCIVAMLTAWIYPVQYYRIINHKAVGIWNA
ncbi:MAG: O-antigen membrane protein [Chlorobi bacterium OLB4]|nr:MAG: polysaccharide biosynthesis protein [Chlorobiota bacterium]KXK06031.1 MAG: O-antigen membrane protein [Chlorobi bacterium OLB4]MBV6398466.1 hypothetical protein [Ignavibacteria bacterium]MCE7953105.1 polysaccharide biosynthesis protein [Chlorobi bacterium CHB7]OQY77950.1 MAG: polysaccharide biosynthesis protein [Ignavibacteriales bacterium UTCHB1]